MVYWEPEGEGRSRCIEHDIKIQDFEGMLKKMSPDCDVYRGSSLLLCSKKPSLSMDNSSYWIRISYHATVYWFSTVLRNSTGALCAAHLC